MTFQYPNSQQIENSIIGSLLINPAALVELDIEPSDFYYVYNKNVYATIQKLYTERKAIDPVIVSENSKDFSLSQLLDLMTNTVSSVNIDEYCAELKNLSRRRVAIHAAETLAKNAFDNKQDLRESIADIMTSLTMLSTSRTGAVHIGQVVKELANDIDEAIKNPRDIFGVPTHMRRLNKILAGFQIGEVVKLSGDPGVGKSLLAFQWVMEAASGLDDIKPTACAVFQLEMNVKAQVRRGLSFRSGIKTRSMRSGKIKDDDIIKLYQSYEYCESLPIYIDDNPYHTTTSLRSEIARLKTHDIKMVLIDYEALLNDAGEENERGSKISDAISAMAKDLHVAIITINDKTKAAMTGDTKGQAGLAGSRRIIYNADVVMFLRKTDTENEYLLDIAKYREGDTDELSDILIKLPELPSFGEKAFLR